MPDQYKLRDILQNKWPVVFKSIKVIKDKERRKIRALRRHDDGMSHVTLEKDSWQNVNRARI